MEIEVVCRINVAVLYPSLLEGLKPVLTFCSVSRPVLGLAYPWSPSQIITHLGPAFVIV
jgi:hypothetical protein